MNFLDIFLILISSAGLLHGITFAIYLTFFKKKKSVTNYLLSLILLITAFRIGKSVMLNFGNDLEPLFIFSGLALLLLIGPLLRWYVKGMTTTDFKFSFHSFIEIIPFIIIFTTSFFTPKNIFETNQKEIIILFSSIIIGCYLHLIAYIFIANRSIRKIKTLNLNQTKAHKAIFKWLHLVIIGFIIIWISYVSNIIEDSIPYIIGPIIYSLVIYYLSFKAYQLKVIDIDGNVFQINNDNLLFDKISSLIINEKLYLESTISLASLSKKIGESTQKTSQIINQYAKQNFNDFINYHRIQEAKKLLINEDYKKFTISAIAYDSGFSSLSSFNSAFKKFQDTTPSLYRKTNT
ncbi:helix-turn-helix domain-containing protein [Aquimarina algiphila]|uniref:helix-turn-helix domain-containing protein n=1 Tax=Aquimarina algiphila TaxID=2047982 RepID=UPI00232CD782|nr:helix-turn-helix domain-containing protein [Aquimarina algiphila]